MGSFIKYRLYKENHGDASRSESCKVFSFNRKSPYSKLKHEAKWEHMITLYDMIIFMSLVRSVVYMSIKQ